MESETETKPNIETLNETFPVSGGDDPNKSESGDGAVESNVTSPPKDPESAGQSESHADDNVDGDNAKEGSDEKMDVEESGDKDISETHTAVVDDDKSENVVTDSVEPSVADDVNGEPKIDDEIAAVPESVKSPEMVKVASPVPPASTTPPRSMSKKPKVDLASIPTRQYLDTTVVPILLQGLSALAKERPQKPIAYLANFLQEKGAEYDDD